jgi:hypothetical protein
VGLVSWGLVRWGWSGGQRVAEADQLG